MQRVNMSGRRSMTGNLTHVMRICIEQMREWDGQIERYPGGDWSQPGKMPAREPMFGSTTITALVDRKLVEYTEQKHSPGLWPQSTFPIKARLLPLAAVIAPPRLTARANSGEPLLSRSTRR